MLALRRAIIWSLGSLSVATLAAQMLQWRPVLPISQALDSYDQAIQIVGSSFAPFVTSIQLQHSAVTGTASPLHPHWPHLFLILALQFLPRAEPFPDWNSKFELVVKFAAASVGLALAFVLANVIGRLPWSTNQTDLLFFLFSLVALVLFQNWLEDWPSLSATLEEQDLPPAFGDKPQPLDKTDYEWPFSAIMAALTALAFTIAFFTAEIGLIPEITVVHAIILLGLVCSFMFGLLLYSSLESGVWLWGNPEWVLRTPLTGAGRLALLFLIIALWFGSLGPDWRPPSRDFLFHVALLIVTLILVSVAHGTFLRLVSPDGELRSYPLPSALGIFVLGATLIYVADQTLSH